MSALHRPFLRRFTLALLGMLLFIAVGFAGLGWMALRDVPVLRKVVGSDRAIRLMHWYSAFMANLLPGDQDGDGVCDGVELIAKSNPRDPTSHPYFYPLAVINRGMIAYCGERLATRWVMGMSGGPVRWPRGFKAVVSADEPILLPKDGTGSPTKGPVAVAVNDRGEVEFDIMAWEKFGDVQINFGDAGSAGRFESAQASLPGWKTPPLRVSIDGRPLDGLSSRGVEPLLSNTRDRSLEWVPSEDWIGDFVIEASRAEGDVSWQAVAVEGWTNWLFYSDLWENYFPGYTGPLKFRVVPVSPTPP